MIPKPLKGYSKGQRALAETIRFNVLRNSQFGYDESQAERLRQRICEITSPMFFIRYRDRLIKGDVANCLSEYSDANYKRKAKFIQDS
ncbi:hypothetical protein HOP38_02535 [Vibrio mediterranei]|uniref:hypothetical protein n=1 Tax=Vibrio mediterranei TaxID=689 RepID=UPI001793AE6C|nr:hypothetical protein [Vibrio mediterranei]NUW71389.1 hypothetical protein [Vibrio mediterranei]